MQIKKRCTTKDDMVCIDLVCYCIHLQVFLLHHFWTRQSRKIIGDIAPTYFVAFAAIVAAFGANAYVDKKK